jgi:uncharacterized protein with GYD domain
MRFLVQWRYSAEAHANFGRHPMDRRAASATIAEAFGGHLIEFHFAFGAWDGVGIYEFPSPTHAAAFSMHLQGTGGFAGLETTVLLTPEESEQAMQMASETRTIVRPPQAQ